MRKARSFLIGCAFLSAVPLQAAFEPTWEVLGSAGASFLYETFGEGGGNGTSVSIGVRGARYLSPQFALFAEPSVVYASTNTGVTYTILTAVVGPHYSFSSEIQNSFYALAGAGIQLYFPGSGTSAALEFEGAVGKRFQLFERVSWSPELNLLGNTSGSGANRLISSLKWSVRLVQLSILF